MAKPILAWHFLGADGHTRRAPGYPPPVKVEVGQTLTETRPLEMCAVGLHASRRAIDALQYAPGPIVCRVRLFGTVLEDADKLCASERTVLAMADASETLHEFGCWCAEQALLAERAAGREPDARCWAAIEAKRAWLKGEITARQLAAARAAAEDAAEAAARDAAEAAAAWESASAAAWASASAARGAAWAARTAARDAAREAARDAQNRELERRLLALAGIGDVSY